MIGVAIDFETTGLDTANDKIIEVGFTKFEAKEGRPLEIIHSNSFLVKHEGLEISPLITEITGISQVDIDSFGVSPLTIFTEIPPCDFFVAHNKAFDRAMYRSEAARQGVYNLFDIPWLCTIEDFEHPANVKCRKLSHMALDYGIAVDPDTLHRAAADTELLVKILDKINCNYNEKLEDLRKPKITIKAIIPKPWIDDGKGKDAASASGFRWDGKNWVKKISEDKFSFEREKLGYDIVQV